MKTRNVSRSIGRECERCRETAILYRVEITIQRRTQKETLCIPCFLNVLDNRFRRWEPFLVSFSGEQIMEGDEFTSLRGVNERNE